jgi:uncharacterized protein
MLMRKSVAEDVLRDHGILSQGRGRAVPGGLDLAGEEARREMESEACGARADGARTEASLPVSTAAAPKRGGAPARKRPPPAECGPLPFLIKRDGSWLYKGTRIGRKELVCLFASVLRREADGTFWLETPAERGPIEVEDAPFVVVEMDWTGADSEQVVTFRTNTDEIVSVDLDHPLRFSDTNGGGEPKPYVFLRQGKGAYPIEARISRPVFYELAALAEPQPVRGKMMLGVWSSGVFFPLGEMPNDET